MPKRIPIRVARELAKAQGLRQVILLAWDGKLSHVVTYGVTVEDCDQAALGGDKLKTALGWPETLNALPSRVQALTKERDALRARVAELETDRCAACRCSDDAHAARQAPVCEKHPEAPAAAIMIDERRGRAMHLMCAACADEAERAGMRRYRDIVEGEVQ